MSERRNPWTSLDRETVYENPWIRVVEHKVLNPARRPSIYGVVEFKSLACGIVPLFEDGTTILVGQHRYVLGAFGWELPGGAGPRDAPPIETARRELHEEAGVVASEWREIQVIHPSNSISTELIHLFVAWGCTIDPAASNPDDNELLEVRRLPFAEAMALAWQGGISDAPTLVALYRAHLMAMRGELPEGIARAMLGGSAGGPP